MLYHNPFLFEHNTRVIQQNNDLVELEETIFYPGGGGQPCDLGYINDSEVIEVFKDKDKILHRIKGYVSGDVILKVNKDRRMKLIMMHTGEHILFKSLEITFGSVELVKIDLDEKESSLFIKTKELDWQRLFKAEELVNKIIDEDRKIIEHEFSKEEAIKKGARIKAERIASEIVRIVEIKDFDLTACAGIHVPSTKYVGNLLITKFSITKGNWEIRFKTDVKYFSQYTKKIREITTLLETDEIIESINRIRKENEEYKEKFRKLSTRLLDYNIVETVNGKRFIYNIVEGIEKKQLIDKSAEHSKDAIVCFINKEIKNTVLLSADQKIGLDIPKILNDCLERFGGKGGGKGSFAMGSFEGDANDFLEFLKKQL